jgi:hypothetical protein
VKRSRNERRSVSYSGLWKGAILGTTVASTLGELLEENRREMRNENITQFKKRRVIEDGNFFPAEPSQYGAFVPIPIVMRAFVFRVLTSPELRAYLHICCYAFGFKTESVTGDRTQRDVGISTRKAVYGPAKRLSELGFVLQAKKGFEHNNPRSINYYQRPSLEYTLLKLLEEKAISSRLVPLSGGRLPTLAVQRDHERWHGDVVDATLAQMLGEERFAKLQEFKREDQRRTFLLEALGDRVAERIDESKRESEQRAKARTKVSKSRQKRANKVSS